MADERLLAGIRRFWSPDEVRDAYKAIFEAYHKRLEKVTVVVQKSNEGESAAGQVVVNAGDYLNWMDALEARMKELEEAEGEPQVMDGTGHVNFSRRWARS